MPLSLCQLPLFNPVYAILNAMWLGHEDNALPLAALGLGSLTIGITTLSISNAMTGGESTLIA